VGEFNDSYRPIADGVAMVVENYSHWLGQAGWRPHVVTPSFPGFHDDAAFPVHRFFSLPTFVRPPYRIGLPQVDFGIRRELKQVPFSLVHAHCPFAAGQLAATIARERNIPLIATFHTKYRDDFERLLKFKPLVDAIIKRVVQFYETADQVWTPGPGTVETLREYGFRGPVEVVPNGSDLAVDDRQRQVLAKAADATLGTAPDETVFLFVGQITLEKNLAILIEAMAELHKQNVPFKLFLVGEGYARHQLEALAAERGLAERVRFLGLVTDRERLAQLYARATLFLFPSQYDTGSLAMREAAGCGTPSVLVTPSTVAEVVRDGQNGFLAPNDACKYAERIRTLLADPATIDWAGRGARRSIYRSWQQIAEEVAARYRDVLAAHRRRARKCNRVTSFPSR
jgi:glycosyltransferase involved in cell wall biosynthesis